MTGRGVPAVSARRVARSTFVFLLVIGSAAGAGASGAIAAEPTGPVLEVIATSSHISLSARDVPLADVLAAIGREAGVRMVLHGELDTPVTASLIDVPVDEAIRRLSRWYSVLLIYGAAEDVRDGDVGLKEAWVMSAKSRPHDVGIGGSLYDAPRPAAREGDRGGVAGASTKNLLEKATKDPSPGVRQTALQRLARQPGVEAVNALRDAAIRDPEAFVRRVAIRALAGIRRAEAGDALQFMLDDADPDIREAASRALRRWQQRNR